MKSFSGLRGKPAFGIPLWSIILLIVLTGSGVASAADSLPVELQLIWATNEPKSPNPKHHPVDADVQKMLEQTPYRWKYYFEVHRRVEDVPGDRSLEKVVMSKHCALDIKYLGNAQGRERVQVKLCKGMASWFRCTRKRCRCC